MTREYTRRVAFLCKMVPHYRGSFFEKLRTRLARSGIELVLVYGDGRESDRQKEDLIDLPWAKRVPNKIIRWSTKELVWQPVLKDAFQADLVIVEQANALLVNYLLQLLQYTCGMKLAFWGHGKNFQASSADSLSERLKSFLCTKVWWWFAYTEETKRIVANRGFPPQKITVVQNSLDTEELTKLVGQITEEDRVQFRNRLGLSANTAIFCGGLYKEKRLEFLIESACVIRSSVPDFCLIIVGSGPEKDCAIEAARKHPWIKYLGPLFGAEKVTAYSASKLTLIPGLVGLVILDSFALSVPLVTTNYKLHSPEIAYLENGVNGIMTPDSVPEFSSKVIELLTDTNALTTLSTRAGQSSAKYTIETMVDNFALGIIEALRTK